MDGARRLLPVLVALASPLAAAAAGAPALRISATPAQLHLAEGSRATLRVACAREAPLLVASVGRIDALGETYSGVYQAEYVPPDSVDPQVAFVTARCGDAFGWVPVGLAGVRDVTVAARHGTDVTVTVENDQFGPVPADAMGRAVVRVVVRPGIRFAVSRNQRIDLHVPSSPLTYVALDRSAVDANSSVAVVVRVLSVDERGAPAPHASIALSASEGVLSAPAETEPGVVQATWKLAPGKVREATVTARRAGRTPQVATAALGRVAGPARSITLDVNRTALIAGDANEVVVTALATDAGGNPTDTPASLQVSGPGTVLEWEREGTGRYVGRVEVPSRRSGRPELALAVSAPGSLGARRVVSLLPGPALQIRVEPRGELYADGRPREIRVAVVDANDNRVDVAEAPIVSAGRGSVGTATRYGQGVYRIDYRAPLAAEDMTDVILVSLGALEGSAYVRVRALGGGVTLAPKVGYAIGTGGLGSLAGGVELGLWVPRLRGLGLLLEARGFGFDRTDTVQGLDVQSGATFVALEAALAWRRPWWGGMGWLAGGGGAARLTSTVSARGHPDLVERSWSPALHARAGWGWPLGPGLPFAEVTAGWQGEPASGPLVGSLRSLTFSVGYRFDVL